jgi:hypothetical protein
VKRTLLMLVMILATNAFAQETTAIPSLQGIAIGSAIDDARAKLTLIGTGGGRDTRDGGRKEAWTLKETDFATLAFKTNGAGKIVWVSAFARPGKELPFAKLGDPAKATSFSKSQAIWNVQSAGGGYRLVAKGAEGKASVVYLLSIDSPAIE